MGHLVIDHIRYLNIVPWLRQNCNFFVSFVPRFPKETWIQIKHRQIIKVCPENLGAILEY